MADKRIYDLSTTLVLSSKYFVLDKSGNAEAEKFSADLIMTTSGAQTITGAKIWNTRLFFGDATAYIVRTGAELEFVDSVTGSKTLAELATNPISIGTLGQIPTVNSFGDDFVYTSNLIYTSGIFTAPNIKVSAIAAGSNPQLVTAAVATGQLVSHTGLTYAGSVLAVSSVIQTDTVRFVDSFTSITRDGANNMEFTDAITGTKTLAQLAAPGISLGTVNQIPYMNAGGTDFLYGSSLQFVTGRLWTSNLAITALALDGGILYSQVATGNVEQSANLTFSSGRLTVATTIRTSVYEIDNTLTKLTIDGSGNMQFTDALTGTKTLAQLAAGGAAVSFGTTTQIPYMNAGGTDFIYSTGLTFTGSQFVVTGGSPLRTYHSTPSGSWSDFPTVLGIWNTGLTPTTTNYGANYYTGLLFQAFGAAAGAAAQGMIALEAMSTTNYQSRFNMRLRGTLSTDFHTPWRFNFDGTTYWQTELSTSDLTMYVRQGSTTVVTKGWDDSAVSYVIAIGTALTSTGRLAIGETNLLYYGSSTANLYIDAATSTATIYLRASSTTDSRILFQNDTTSRFIMGYDYSVSRFQIHSSSVFSTAADFQISLAGDVGFGVAPSTTYPIYVYKSHTSGTQYIMNLYHDGNNAIAAQGIRMQIGADTLSTTDQNYILALDGNGTTVGSILADSGSFRLFNAVSSKKLKKNIRVLDENVMDKFRNPKSQPKRYNFKGRNKADEQVIKDRGEELHDIVGFIIEDLQEQFPDAVKQIDDGKGGTIPAYADTKLIPYIVKALVELDQRINSIETQ